MPQDDDVPIYLNALTLRQLQDFAASLTRLSCAADVLADSGFAPVFDLTPGLPISIRLDFRMPADPRVADMQAFAPMVGENVSENITKLDQNADSLWGDVDVLSRRVRQLDLQAEISSGYQDHPSLRAYPPPDLPVAPVGSPLGVTPDLEIPNPEIPEPLAVRAAGEGIAGDDPDPASPAPKPAASPADAPPDNAPVIRGSARDLAQSVRPPRWTDEEDAQAVALAVDLQMRRYHNPKELAEVIGPTLNRPIEGTAFRIRTILGDRIAAQVSARMKLPKTTVDLPGVPLFAAPPELTTDDLGRYLATIPYPGKWTRRDDVTLFDLLCTGMQPDAIAAEMDIGRDDVVARFDLLTGYDRNTKKRAFIRSAVLDALIALQGKGA